ncbi:IclR family transcriptional regulator [Rhodococcus sp. NPDC057529]|uniref:IclR family transcriptional regulator n=1 Tax=Rhodococcus sp. NPDC057529 TaxID=3346158 RepID=UPI00366EA61B
MRNNVGVSRLESVDRALQLLVLLRDGGPVSVTAAAQHLGVVPSTAHRLLGALCARGFAVQNAGRLYQAGPEIAVLTDSSQSLAAVRKAARRALEWLTDTMEETSQLMVLKGGNIEFIDGVESGGVLRVTARTGERMPAYCSAGGKALLAELGDDEIDRIYHRGLPPWRTARITDLTSLKTHLAGVHRIGYGINVEETESGVCGVGVCVRDDTGRPIAALTLAIPSPRFGQDKLDRYVDALHTAAAMVQQQLR